MTEIRHLTQREEFKKNEWEFLNLNESEAGEQKKGKSSINLQFESNILTITETVTITT